MREEALGVTEADPLNAAFLAAGRLSGKSHQIERHSDQFAFGVKLDRDERAFHGGQYPGLFGNFAHRSVVGSLTLLDVSFGQHPRVVAAARPHNEHASLSVQLANDESTGVSCASINHCRGLCTIRSGVGIWRLATLLEYNP
jgi:hypothetical protein